MTHQHQDKGSQKPGGLNPQAVQARSRIESMKRQFEQRRNITSSMADIKNQIGVYSGKGGVGKTSVAVNLAVTLAKDGAKVGILDVDIDCPNVVRAMKIYEPPVVSEDKKMDPPERFGVKVMSMAFFQDNEDEAIIWRGPMIHNAIQQILQSTQWGVLDYLVVDLPPGTSDSPLTVMQTIALDGFVVVSTPQELAVVDAKRSINMIKTLKLNVLGIVENMAGDMFGSGGGEQLAAEMGLQFLGRTEMRKDYRSANKPASLSSKDVRKEYEHIAERVKEALAGISEDSGESPDPI